MLRSLALKKMGYTVIFDFLLEISLVPHFDQHTYLAIPSEGGWWHTPNPHQLFYLFFSQFATKNSPSTLHSKNVLKRIFFVKTPKFTLGKTDLEIYLHQFIGKYFWDPIFFLWCTWLSPHQGLGVGGSRDPKMWFFTRFVYTSFLILNQPDLNARKVFLSMILFKLGNWTPGTVQDGWKGG